MVKRDTPISSQEARRAILFGRLVKIPIHTDFRVLKPFLPSSYRQVAPFPVIYAGRYLPGLEEPKNFLVRKSHWLHWLHWLHSYNLQFYLDTPLKKCLFIQFQ